MKHRRSNLTNLLTLALVLGSFAITAALYARLPQTVPIHWDLRGEADGLKAKPWGPLLLPLTTAGVALLLAVVPAISPSGFGVARFRTVFEVFQLAIVAFLSFVTVLALLAGVGVSVPMGGAVQAGLGVVVVVLGNFMGKVTRNFFVGIRTPWTLASEEVWLRTHRLGGRLFVLAGLCLVLTGLFAPSSVVGIAAIVLAAILPVLYSYLSYRRLEGGSR